MNILRLSTLSLTLAIAVFALGYNPSFADKPNSDGCGQVHCDHGEDLGDLTYTVNLIGPIPPDPPSVRGAFEFEGGLVSATLESKGRVLKGDAPVTMKRPVSDLNAVAVWEDVFNLCFLLGSPGATLLTQFTVEIGDWSVSNSSEKQFISFGFEIAANFSPPSSRPLSAFLQLSRDCASVAACRANIPTAPGNISLPMTDYSIHLRGKKGVTQQADCHGDKDSLSGSGSTLVIEAT